MFGYLKCFYYYRVFHCWASSLFIVFLLMWSSDNFQIFPGYPLLRGSTVFHIKWYLNGQLMTKFWKICHTVSSFRNARRSWHWKKKQASIKLFESSRKGPRAKKKKYTTPWSALFSRTTYRSNHQIIWSLSLKQIWPW